MPKPKSPRHGSMQFWPHKRAQKETPIVKKYAKSKDATPLGFAGYKVGMTHVQYVENDKNSPKKGETVTVPVTVVECPPLHVVGFRTYAIKNNARQPKDTIYSSTLPKYAERKLSTSKTSTKQADASKITAADLLDVVLLVAATPSVTGIGKKKPDVFELGIGGTPEQQLKFAQENMGKTIDVASVFKNGEFVDIHGITKGKGFSSAIARFGIRRRQHKSEKGIRTAGSLGGWSAQGHVMYRVPAPGKHGYYKRITYNQKIMHIGTDPATVNPSGGFVRYGVVKNSFLLVKGSIHGPAKRIVRFTKATRPDPKVKPTPLTVDYVFTGSHQG